MTQKTDTQTIKNTSKRMTTTMKKKYDIEGKEGRILLIVVCSILIVLICSEVIKGFVISIINLF